MSTSCFRRCATPEVSGRVYHEIDRVDPSDSGLSLGRSVAMVEPREAEIKRRRAQQAY